MNNLIERLTSNFVIVNLGAGGDSDYKAPPEVLKSFTVVELDGGNQPICTSDVYHKKHRITEFVSGSGGPRTFYQRAFWGCSGLAATKDAAIQKYGVQTFCKLVSSQPIVTRSLVDLLAEAGIRRVDFLKTDLEGIDFEVVQNTGKLLPDTLAVQSELRFDPLFEGEAPCEEAIMYLRQRGFELVGLKPEFWKPHHPNWTQIVDGNIVWADFLFMRTPESVIELWRSQGDTLCLHKHVIIAAMLGKFNHACRLFHLYRQHLEQQEVMEMVNILNRFATCNPALIGRLASPDFPHLADPVVSIKA